MVARLYDPDAIGVYSYLTGVSMVITSIAGLRYEWAIPLPSSDDEARSVLQLFLMVVAATSVFVVGALLLVQVFVGDGSLTPLPWSWALPAVVGTTACFAGLNQMALRKRLYGAVGKRNLTQNLTLVMAQTCLGAVGLGPIGLYIGQVAGRAVSALTLARAMPGLLATRSGAALRGVACAYWRFPLVFSASSLLNTLGTYLPIIVVSHSFGAAAAGQLGIAQTVSLAPVSLVGTAIGQVYIGDLAAKLRGGLTQTKRSYVRDSAILAAAAGALAAIFVLAGPRLVPAILGAEWVPAGRLLRSVAVAVALGFVVSPLAFVLVAYQRSGISLLLDVSRVFLVAVPGVLAARGGSSLESVVLVMSLGQAVNYALTWVAGYRAIGRPRAGRPVLMEEVQ